MLANIATIWRKELTDTIRDRKALLQAMLVPLAIGVLYAIINPLLAASARARAEEPITVPARGIEHAGEEFIATLELFDIALTPFEGDMDAAIRAGEEPAGLVIPPGFRDQVAGEELPTLTLRTNHAAGGLFGGTISVRRLKAALAAYGQAMAVQRLQAREINAGALAAVRLDIEDLATPAQRAGLFAALMLPLLVGLVTIQGGMFIAIDVTAGERERGTLEALLVTPASDAEILLGKLAAVFTMTMVPVTLTLLGYWGAAGLLPRSMTNGAVLPFTVVLYAILVSVPLTLFLNVALMLLSIRTKTFKEAQSYATALIFLVTMVAMAAAFTRPRAAWVFLVPVYGTAAAVGALASGCAVPANAVLLSIVGAMAAAAGGILLALRRFDRERLLYAT